MGVSRIRPSRVIIDTGDIKASLPSTSGERATFEVAGVPTRGIIHDARFVYTSTSSLNGNANEFALIHTSGTAATSTATALPAADALSSLAVCKFQERAPAGIAIGNIGLPTGSFMMYVNLLVQYIGVADGGAAIANGPVAYDVSGDTAGPTASDGKLYFTLVSAQRNFTAVGSAKLVLEIEPCF